MNDVKFDDKKIVGVTSVTLLLTENDIDNIVVTALEGGIGYWARLDNTGEDWKRKPKGVPTSQWATFLLLEGKSIKFNDAEEDDDEDWILTLPKLVEGFKMNYTQRPHDNNIEYMDA